ncbi:RodZ domain-containing protein [Neptuniibacter sp.]|uniref:RodZ domain-containing protein n=1 Tax=Neptuniibacter sp. TaxID=1962643 RepID=UPI002630BDC4|nr:RodZ domain-containing protein [Neptuniibacter sp.]MCP4598790.1 helix-turn-helix domain-containing protein [Neptuniibacter sp.]
MSNEEQECQPELLAEEWGARLTSARESLSISTEQAAADLNLPHDYICKLEQGALEGLPSMVFAKGYIRAYAKLLNLDDNELVEEYEGLHGEGGGKGQIRPVSRVRQQVKMNDPVMKFTSWLFILGIIGVSVWWWQTQYGGTLTLPTFTSDQEKAVETEEVTTPVVEMADGSAQLVLPKLDDAPVDEAVAVGAGSTVNDEVNETEAPAEPAAPSEASAPQAETEPEYLSESEIKKLQQEIDGQTEANNVTETVVETASQSAAPVANLESPELASISADFVAECWVSIKDADGKTLFNNLRGKGQSVNVTGKPPLNVLIGATSAVGRFAFNGSELDLAEHSRKNIVRINLPLAE